ncbi:endonuclease/exonuclease/phosphatase family protein [Alcanivorax sp. JB21]|uniref:endonuclease/exonuclease/phosphatase family protein n=1 Tax=Alcanivorax limicola TaxID=2874102 RepID=UPI001CBD5459|nr:endonuclease/exonuclease/phosphatase family protein [Alcanivorax limicola]MBZ2190349.1 endonuclease/exonuclease/phosphatase family protein [Alcanivorax limicola]
MRILTWNLAWATVTSAKGQEIIRRIEEVQPDVAILTEVTTPLVEALGGCAAYSSSDHGYGVKPLRRKVALWSRSPIVDVDSTGSPDLPPGRFVAARINGMRVLGVCIPWRDAHVRTGRKDASPWEEHSRYLEALHSLIKPLNSNTIVGGDFNQRNPRHRQPQDVFRALDKAFSHMTWVTSGEIGASGERAIDHIVATPEMDACFAGNVSSEYGATRLSDHFGLYCEINPVG